MTKRVQRICILLTAALLLLLFTLPGRFLRRTGEALRAAADEAEASITSGNDPAPALSQLTLLYDRYSGTWRLFLDHASVDAVGAAVAACTPLAPPDTLVAALHTLDAALSHLLAIESLSAENLL